MRALVTGAGGFVGRYVLQRLLQDGVDCFAMTHGGWHEAEKFANADRVHVFEADIRDGKRISSLIREIRPHQIYHLAAITSVPASFSNPTLTFEVNVNGVLNLFESVRQSGINAKILNVSTSHVYRVTDLGGDGFAEDSTLDPCTPYATSKILAETLARHYQQTFGMNIVTVRPFNHIGPLQSADFVCSDFARQIVAMRDRKKPAILYVGNLDVERDFTDVRDVVEAYLHVMSSSAPGEVFNVCSGLPIKLRDILDLLCRIAGVSPRIFEEEDRLRKADARRVFGNPSKINRQTGWKPQIQIEQTLQDIIEFWSTKNAVSVDS